MTPTPNTAGPLENLFTAILLTWLVAGTADAIGAIVSYLAQGGKKPEIIFKYIASGVFGGKAYTSGPVMILWGVLFHFLITLGLTLFFYWIYPQVKWIRDNIIPAAFLYGIFAWLVTTRVIVPLSKIKQGPFVLTKALIAIGILVVCIGLPIALMTRKHYLYKK